MYKQQTAVLFFILIIRHQGSMIAQAAPNPHSSQTGSQIIAALSVLPATSGMGEAFVPSSRFNAYAVDTAPEPPLSQRLSSRALVRQLFPQHPTSIVVHAHTESDLAQAISAASGPDLTIITLPASITLTQALPSVMGPLQLISAGTSASITCSLAASTFTALTILSQSFSMSGLAWVGCSSVLNVTGASQVTIDSCSFVANNNSARNMVS